MSDPVEIALITAAGVALSGLFSTVVIVLVKRLEVKVDGRLTDLLNLTRKSSHAQGVKDEKESQNGRTT
jgi:hypothetical protein